MHVVDDIMTDRGREDGREGHGTGDGSGISIVDRNKWSRHGQQSSFFNEWQNWWLSGPTRGTFHRLTVRSQPFPIGITKSGIH